MKLKVLVPLTNKGKNYEAGDEINVPDEKVQVFLNKGSCPHKFRVCL